MAEKSLIQDYITEKFLAAALFSWQSIGTGQKGDTRYLRYAISLTIESGSNCNLQQHI